VSVVDRPGVGKDGRKIQIKTNFFELRSFPDWNLFQYDVSIAPGERIPPSLARDIFKRLLDTRFKEFGEILCFYDGRAYLIAPKRLPFSEKTFDDINVPNPADPTKERKFSFTIKFASEVNMQELVEHINGRFPGIPRPAIQALEIVLTAHACSLYETKARSFYPSINPLAIGEGCDVWLGYRQSIKAGMGKVYLNLDVSATTFLTPGPLINYILANLGPKADIRDLQRGLPRSFDASRKLKGIRIEVDHMKRKQKYLIVGVSDKTAKTMTFEVEGKGKTSVANYFRSKYGITLNYPDMPLIKVGSPSKNICLPIELCSIVPGQRYMKKLSPIQTQGMIKATTQPPERRLASILHGVTASVRGDDPYAKSFGLKVNTQPVVVDARVLPPPAIGYLNDSVTPSSGAWKGKKFHKPAKISKWSFLVLERESFLPAADISRFVAVFTKIARECGMSIEDERPRIDYADSRKIDIFESVIKKIRAAHKPDIIFVVVPRQDSAVYGEIKRVCETVVDVMSQVMLAKHVKKANDQYIRNILLKVNVKLDGINSTLGASKSQSFILGKPAIIFGADVSHPAKGSSLPSIAAVVASMDARAYSYASSIRSQNSREEIIVDLKNMVKELLIEFKSRTRKRPEKIVFYRDGVSEGQFDSVLSQEVLAIKRACQELNKDYNPELTFIIVQKRHHSRFFVTKPADADKSGNIPPGTVVDTSIVSPAFFDFYLCSHAGLQGTSRPAHYYVLFDENRFTADLIQEFTNRLCYSYARCTRSVSIVPPAYYAHLVAYRARFHARGDMISEEGSIASGSAAEERVIDFAPVLPETRKVMFFM